MVPRRTFFAVVVAPLLLLAGCVTPGGGGGSIGSIVGFLPDAAQAHIVRVCGWRESLSVIEAIALRIVAAQGGVAAADIYQQVANEICAGAVVVKPTRRRGGGVVMVRGVKLQGQFVRR